MQFTQATTKYAIITPAYTVVTPAIATSCCIAPDVLPVADWLQNQAARLVRSDNALQPSGQFCDCLHPCTHTRASSALIFQLQFFVSAICNLRIAVRATKPTELFTAHDASVTGAAGLDGVGYTGTGQECVPFHCARSCR